MRTKVWIASKNGRLYYRSENVPFSSWGQSKNNHDSAFCWIAEVMLGNVFKQLATEALTVSKNPTVSHIVQKLVEEATVSQLVMVMNAFATDWEAACSDR